MLATSYIHQRCNSAEQCPCGKVNLNNNTTEPSMLFPWLVTLYVNGQKPHCYGTLLNNLYVLTSAECTKGNPGVVKDLTRVSFGTYVDVNIKAVVPSPKTSNRPRSSALTLLKLYMKEAKEDFKDDIYPACLPAKNQPTEEGKYGQTFNWTENVPTEIDLKIQSEVCHYKKGKSTKLNGDKLPLDRFICAGEVEMEACHTRAGIPLMFKDKRYTVIGVASSFEDYNMCRTSQGLFTRVTAVLGWIKETIQYPDDC